MADLTFPPDPELDRRVAGIDPSLDLPREVRRLLAERNAILIAHYYQEPAIQDLADVVGDSLALSQAAARAKRPVIVFAGVHFMAETAKILSPEATVLVPDLRAGCSMDEGCPPAEFERFRREHADHVAVTYINCSAAVKAMSDIICTSSNAADIVAAIPPDRKVLFAPDRYLARWVAGRTGRQGMAVWQSSCIVHEIFSAGAIATLKAEKPRAEIIAHPECDEPVLAQAAFVGSTTALIDHVTASAATEFIVATEPGVLHQMQRRCPGKTFWPAPSSEGAKPNTCPHMRLNTLAKLYLCLRDLKPAVEVDLRVIDRARVPIQRMLDFSAGHGLKWL